MWWGYVVMMTGGVKVTRGGEQEAGGGQQAAESCYRGGEETEWCPEETTRSDWSESEVTLPLTLTLTADWSEEKHLILAEKL